MTNDELLARLDERQQAMDEKIDAILEQTKKTNGRLLVAESNINELSTWKAVIKGQMKIVVFIAGLIITLIGWMLTMLK
jgi:uncharacterized protein YaaR (DUF327 family)